MEYKIKLRAKVEKSLHKIEKNYLKRIRAAIIFLPTNPYRGKNLKGDFKMLYSVRVWPYRIIYLIDEDNKTIEIIRIEHRQGVYKNI